MSREVFQVRSDEIKLIKYDDPYANIRYIGRSSSMRALDSDAVWQIMRIYKNCGTGITTTNHANMGEFNCVWNDRTTYFPAAVGDNSCSVAPATSITGSVTGSFTQSGLSIAGLITEVTINNTTWTALPATPLVDRNAISIQNTSGVEIKLNYNSGAAGYIGARIPVDGERFYQITDTILIYAKSQAGTVTILVEELS